MIMLRCSKTKRLGLGAWATPWLLSAFTLEAMIATFIYSLFLAPLMSGLLLFNKLSLNSFKIPFHFHNISII
jgi:hypothetical protein